MKMFQGRLCSSPSLATMCSAGDAASAPQEAPQAHHASLAIPPRGPCNPGEGAAQQEHRSSGDVDGPMPQVLSISAACAVPETCVPDLLRGACGATACTASPPSCPPTSNVSLCHNQGSDPQASSSAPDCVQCQRRRTSCLRGAPDQTRGAWGAMACIASPPSCPPTSRRPRSATMTPPISLSWPCTAWGPATSPCGCAQLFLPLHASVLCQVFEISGRPPPAALLPAEVSAAVQGYLPPAGHASCRSAGWRVQSSLCVWLYLSRALLPCRQASPWTGTWLRTASGVRWTRPFSITCSPAGAARPAAAAATGTTPQPTGARCSASLLSLITLNKCPATCKLASRGRIHMHLLCTTFKLSRCHALLCGHSMQRPGWQ